MAQFVLNWFAAPVMVNPNATGQRALYRQKSVGGSFISTGFTPANDLPKTTEQTTSPVLGNNIIWEFKVQALCTVGGPTDNDNGLVEDLEFQCLVPTLTWDQFDATIQLNVAGTDISKAIFTLHLASDDSVVDNSGSVNRIGTIIQYQATGIDADTEYYWRWTMQATVNGVEITSSSVSQLGTFCQSVDFTTNPDVCLPITDITAEAEETA